MCEGLEVFDSLFARLDQSHPGDVQVGVDLEASLFSHGLKDGLGILKVGQLVVAKYRVIHQVVLATKQTLVNKSIQKRRPG